MIRISRKTMRLDLERGGCRMININSFIKSLNLTWIKRLLIKIIRMVYFTAAEPQCVRALATTDLSRKTGNDSSTAKRSSIAVSVTDPQR